VDGLYNLSEAKSGADQDESHDVFSKCALSRSQRGLGGGSAFAELFIKGQARVMAIEGANMRIKQKEGESKPYHG